MNISKVWCSSLEHPPSLYIICSYYVIYDILCIFYLQYVIFVFTFTMWLQEIICKYSRSYHHQKTLYFCQLSPHSDIIVNSQLSLHNDKSATTLSQCLHNAISKTITSLSQGLSIKIFLSHNAKLIITLMCHATFQNDSLSKLSTWLFLRNIQTKKQKDWS